MPNKGNTPKSPPTYGACMSNGWVGVDLDGTLAEYHGWMGVTHIGPPVPRMLHKVKTLLAQGVDVRVFTARVCSRGEGEAEAAIAAIQAWCLEHVGRALLVTNVKDYGLIEYYDDRAIQVERNTGRRLDGQED